MMTDDWQRRQDLFHDLLGLDESSRAGRLADVARDDPSLAAELTRLVAAAEVERVDAAFAEALRALVEPPALAPGTAVGPYRLGREIGRGGMGIVWDAVHEETGRTVALKLLAAHAGGADDHARVTREYRLLASLDDERHIARLFDVGLLADGTPWFAMELVRGALPITRYCNVHGLDLARRLDLFLAAVVAVRHAHSRGVIHRDLKPSNILVSDTGQVRVVDFGIARATADVLPSDDARVSMQSLTLEFSAPEQLAGEPPGTPCDLYVLGVVLYELLTGSRPWRLDGCSASDALAIVRSGPPRPPSAVRQASILGTARADWADLDALCLKLLAPDPRTRYASADGLVTDLDRYRSGDPLLARAPTAHYRLRKFVTRHRLAVVAAAAVTLGAAGLSTAYGVRLAAERRETAFQAARTARLQQFLMGLFAGAEPDVGPSRDLTVRRLLERGALTADFLQQDPDVQADLQQTLGALFVELGDYDRAEVLLERSLAQKAARLPADDPRRIEGMVALALLRTDQAAFEEAERLARDAIEQLTRTRTAGPALRLRADLALGRVLNARGRYPEAIAHLQASAAAGESVASAPDMSAVLSELAVAHQYAGHLDDAELLHRRALDLDRRMHGPRHPTVADTLISLAEAESSRGRYQDAEPLVREAREILMAWYGADHPETGSATRILAGTLTMQGRLDEADPLLREAVGVFERAYSRPHRRLGLALNDLGTLAFRRKRFDESVRAYEQALATYRQVFPDGRSKYISVGLANLGSAHLEAGATREAERFFRDAVELSRAVLSPDHTNTAIAEVRLGDALVRQGRYADALSPLEHGVAVLAAQGNPALSWLTRARVLLENARTRSVRQAGASERHSR